jgi:uncharacterized protein YebE (UPF0316 family)
VPTGRRGGEDAAASVLPGALDSREGGGLMDWLTALIACLAFAAQFFCAGVIVGMKWQERTKN